MRVVKRPKLWPAWWYGPNGEAEIFQYDYEVPSGWKPRPFKPDELIVRNETRYDRKQIIEDLAAKGIVADPRWSVVRLKELLDNTP